MTLIDALRLAVYGGVSLLTLIVLLGLVLSIAYAAVAAAFDQDQDGR